jgi:hypothetical protein
MFQLIMNKINKSKYICMCIVPCSNQEEPQPILEFGLFPEKPAIYKTLVEQHTDE